MQHNRLNGCVVTPVFDGHATTAWATEYVIHFNSFVEFLEDIPQKLAVYPIVDNIFLSYIPNNECNTGPFRVSISSTFCGHHRPWWRARKRDKLFYHLYRITIGMSADAGLADCCRFKSYRNVITDAQGNERVTGKVVTGDEPVILRPGLEFSWNFDEFFPTRFGTMHGYFTMEKLNDPTIQIRIECPVCHMTAPEILSLA